MKASIARLLTSLVAAWLVLCGVSPSQLLHRDRYKLHAGDQIKVDYTYTPELGQTTTIQPDGFVVLDTGGPVLVAGLTLDEATAAIRKNSTRLKDPVVTVTLVDFQKPYFIVAGQVQTPARFDLRESTTALRALMLAGGAKNTGKESQVIVFHDMDGPTPQVRVLNFRHPEKKEIFENDMELDSGDIVYVPRSKLSRIDDLATVASALGLYINAATYIATR